MELPITVMITLFVAVVVGATIIVFAKQSLTDANDDLGNVLENKPETLDEKIITVGTLSETGVRSLAESCAQDAIIDAELQKRTCVIIKADTINLPATFEPLTVKGRDITIINNIAQGKTVFMTYEPGQIELTT